jgi:diguanylate cyclase (GGDEF)-like protein
LRHVADLLTRRLRDRDLIARIGGDEFAILLPDSSKSNATAVAGDLKRLLQESKLDLGTGTRISLSISVGLAIIDKTTASLQTVVDDADRAMYEEKRVRLGTRATDAIAANHPWSLATTTSAYE